MTPNDKQIDLLMRRHAQSASRANAGEHLDADEMNAFAEGNLAPAARAHYVSHLADCDRCRNIVAQVSLSSGAGARVEPVVEKRHGTFWQTLTAMFALPILRYAAFAAVLLVVAGVAFVALRNKRPTELVAVSEPANQQPVSATKAPDTTGNDNNKQLNSSATPAPVAQPTAAAGIPKVGETSTAPTTTTLKDQPTTIEPEKKAAEPAVAAKAPYSPPPPGEIASAGAREQQNVAGTVSARKAETTDKLAAQQERDATKESGRADQSSGYVMNQPAARQRSGDEKAKSGPSRNFENLRANQSANDTRAESPKTVGGDDKRATSEEAPTTRTVGGRTFRKQGGAWVDQKFKSSMTLKRVSRGSDEFSALDSGLRTIAQQLGGEVIVVWKGQAYLIK